MSLLLYRRMSVEEIEKSIEGNKFYKANNQIYLQRKWFTNSVLKAHYFKNPLYNGETGIVKVEVNDDYFSRILNEGEFLSKEPNAFYAFKDRESSIVYAHSHKNIEDLYNIGILDLDSFNGYIKKDGITVIEPLEYYDYIESLYLEDDILNMKYDDIINSQLEYYVQVPFDVACVCYKYQTLITESINPIIKDLHFTKNIKELEKVNLGKFSTTLKVRFKHSFKGIDKFNEFRMFFDAVDIVKYSGYIEEVSIADYIEKDYMKSKDYISIPGDNSYLIHESKEFNDYERLSFEDFESITLKLLRGEFKIDDISAIILNLKDIDNVSQVNPKDIDMLKTHIEKSVNMSNLVLNYFKSQEIELDTKDVVILKWVLLLHDLGKPYCDCNGINNRYSQFVDKDLYTDKIIDNMLDPDISFPIKCVLKIFRVESLIERRKINRLFNGLIKDIRSHYDVDLSSALDILGEYLKVSMVARVSHVATLRTRSFCFDYVDELRLFDRITTYLLLSYKYSYNYCYEDFYSDLDGVYNSVIESYYLDNDNSAIDKVRGMLRSDYDDLCIVYESKKNEVFGKLLKQYNYDILISKFFKEDNEILLEFFSDSVGNYDTHGVVHSTKVGILSYLLGKLENLNDKDIRLLLLASKYHDIGRGSSNHSIRSVELLSSINELNDYEDINYLKYIIEAHGIDDNKMEELLNKYNIDRNRALSLLALFKDADALDRVRMDSINSKGSVLNPNYLRCENSKRLIKFAYLLDSQFKLKKKEINPSTMKLILSNQ